MSIQETTLVAKLLSRLSGPMASAVADTIKVARRRGLSLYLVGGGVRDLVLERSHLDVDLAVEGDAASLAEEVAVAVEARLAVHQRFGTASLRGPDISLDLAQTRDEHYERSGALPSVRPAAIAQDLARRDFTVNALALGLAGEKAGHLLDPHGGQRDLAARRLRVLHERSFQDDATRMLRGLRYEGRLNFRLDSGTQRLLCRDLSYLDTISGARLRRELLAILAEDCPERILVRAQALGVLSALHPALSFDRRRAAAFVAARDRPLGAFVRDIPLSADRRRHADPRRGRGPRSRPARRVGARPARWRPPARGGVAVGGARPAAEPGGGRLGAVQRRRRERRRAAGSSGHRAKAAATVPEHWRYRRSALRGRDLLALDVAPGPAMGRMLARLRVARLDGEARGREDEVTLVRAWLSKDITSA